MAPRLSDSLQDTASGDHSTAMVVPYPYHALSPATPPASRPHLQNMILAGNLSHNRVRSLYPMDSDASLESLMAGYQQGDLAAATALVNRLSAQLHRFFLMQFVSRRYADDLLQETWLRIHQVRHTYRPGQPVLPWLYAIARHIRVDHYRKAQRSQIREQSLDESGDIPQTAGTGQMAGAGQRPEPGPPDSRSGNAACYATGEPARSDRDVEGFGDVAGRGGAGHFIERRVRQAESPSRL